MQVVRTSTEDQAKRVARCGDVALHIEVCHGAPPRDWSFGGCIFCNTPEAADIIFGIFDIKPKQIGNLHRFSLEFPTSLTGTPRARFALAQTEGEMLHHELQGVAENLIASIRGGLI